MKHIIYGLILSFGMGTWIGSQPAIAQTVDEQDTTVVETEAESGVNGEDTDEIKDRIREDVRGIVEDAMESESMPGDYEARKKRIRNNVLSIVDNVLDAVEKDLEKEVIVIDGDRDVGNGKKDRESHSITIGSSGDGMAYTEFVIAVLAITLVFGTPIMLVAAFLYAGQRKRRMVQDTINQYLASGKDVPPEILASLQTGSSGPRNYLQRGTVWTGVGMGIFICFLLIGSIEAASLGLIPLFIGLAQLLIWKLEQKEKDGKD